MPFSLSNIFRRPPIPCRENPKFLIIDHKVLLDISLFSLTSFPIICSLTQSIPATQVYLIFPHHGRNFFTSGPLHLFISSHDTLLLKPQTTFLAYIRNLLKCYFSVWASITIVFNVRTASFHYHQKLYMLSLLYFMLFLMII